MSRVTHLQANVVSSRPEVVFVRPLGPLASFFDINWAGKVSLSTSWQSDVTRAQTDAAQSRRRLVTRPSRRQSVSLAGLSRDEALAAQNTALRHAETPSPVALYSEVVTVSEIIFESANAARIFGKFERRRFHLGQRLLFVKSPGKNWDSPASLVGYAVVRGASPGAILVFLTDLIGNPSAFDVGSKVYPMMDCRLALTTSGRLITDEALEVTLESSELDGPSALPASWKGSPTNLFPVVGDTPFLQSTNGIPVLAPRIQMSRGLPKTWRRFGEETTSGKSVIVRTDGGTFAEWSVAVEGEREHIWRMLNFFDWARGRGRAFYFSDAFVPWELIEVDPSGSFATVKAKESIDNLNSFYSHVAVVLPGEPQPYGVVTVTGFTKVGENIRIDWSPALPPLPYAAFGAYVIPISLATFGEDVFEETWETPEVGTTQVSIVGALNEREVIIPRWEDPPVLEPAFGPLTEQILKDVAFWVSAGRNCFQEDVPGSRILKRASQWPNLDNFAQWLFDNREQIPNSVEKIDAPNIAIFQVGAQSVLFRYRSLLDNNNRPAILEPLYNYFPHTTFGNDMHISEKHLWGRSGFTIMVCMTPGGYGAYPTLGFGIEDDLGTRLMEWFFALSPGGNSRAWVVSSSFPYELIGNTVEGQYPVVAYLRWANGRLSMRVGNGPVQATTSTPVSSLPLPNGYQAVNWFDGVAQGTGITSAREVGYGEEAALNQTLWVKRPMSAAEIDAVASRWIEQYGGPPWEPTVTP